jgi:integrase
MSKRHHGDGSIDARGPDRWRLRYRIGGKRFSTAFHGELREARRELRRLLRTGDVGEHIAPDKVTLAEWIAGGLRYWNASRTSAAGAAS